MHLNYDLYFVHHLTVKLMSKIIIHTCEFVFVVVYSYGTAKLMNAKEITTYKITKKNKKA